MTEQLSAQELPVVAVPGQRLPETQMAYLTEQLMHAYDIGDDAIAQNIEGRIGQLLVEYPDLR